MASSHSVRRIHDLTDSGYPEVPLLGQYRFLRAQEELLPHIHEGIVEICFLAEGRQVYGVEGKEYVLEAGDLFVTAPGEVHSSRGNPQERGALFWIQIVPGPPSRGSFLGQAPKMAGEVRSALLRLAVHRHFHGSDDVRMCFERLFRLLEKPQPLMRVRLGALLVDLLCEVVACVDSASKTATNSSMNRVLAHIERNPDKRLTPSDLAVMAGISVSWFKSRFRRELGMGPADYVLRRKIQRARQLIDEGNASLSAITFDLGFSSQQYFATVFRRYCNQSPSAYRRKCASARG